MGRPHSTLQPLPMPSSTPPNQEPGRETSWRQALKATVCTAVPNPIPNTIPVDNIFVPIEQDNILPQIPISRHHPVARKGIEDYDDRTLHTNKFYANAFLGEQDQPIWTHPYTIWWGKGKAGGGRFPTWGINISHTEAKDLIMPETDPVQYYVNPRLQSIILTARELNGTTTLSSDTHLPFSVNLNLNHKSTRHEPKMTFPLVQGMCFVTARYRNATPLIQTGGKGFRGVSGPIAVGASFKYRVKDMNGRDWVAYVNPVANVRYDATKFTMVNAHTLMGPSGFKGTIQVAKNPLGAESEALYDQACGSFVCEAQLVGAVVDTRATYSLNYSKIGQSPLLMFALPHHIQSLDPELKPQVTNLQLRTTTKGMATAIWSDRLTCTELNLPTTMSFGPWSPTIGGSKARYPPEFLSFLSSVAERDLRGAMTEDISQDSLYYAGKSLAKFATIVWVLKDVLNNNTLAAAGLDLLKNEMARYVDNRQKYPIYYDDTWKGVVSNAGFTDPTADHGNTFYNDHHFHFGYFVYTSAVIGYLDPLWLEQGDNKAWTNMLVKDFAESDYNGRDYPFFRSFDWWHGHSWARGLFESADGKDEESTSEDGFASFAMKMWGKVIGDVNMEKRGNLMLAIQSRSFNTYFYLTTSNPIHPPRFLDNKLAGVLSENKVDHTTHHATSPPLIHGTHMLPLAPPSYYLRPRAFVREEWEALWQAEHHTPPTVQSGIRGILYANLALVDARASYSFFRDGARGVWDERWIDGGGSRTWYLVFAAGLGALGR